MDKSVDTQWLSPRQVLFLGPATSELRPLVAQALRLPDYVLGLASTLDEAVGIIEGSKIEVVLFEPEAGKTRGPLALASLHAADADSEIVVLVSRLSLVGTVAALQGDGESTFDVLAAPFIGPELVRTVERARQLRYLRRSEERRLRAEARMSAVVQGVPHGVVSLDQGGTIHDWNPGAREIFGWSADEAVGRSLWELALPDHSSELRQLLASGEDVAFRRRAVVGRRRDGAEFPAVVSMASVALPGRAMFCAAIEDVTDARRLEIELRHAQKMEAVGRLAAGMAHEINTPCQFIGSNGSFLTEAFAELDGLLRIHEELSNQVGSHPAATKLLSDLAVAEAGADLGFLREHVPGALRSIGEGIRRIATIVEAMKDFARPDEREAGLVDVNQGLANTLTVTRHQREGAAASLVTRFGEIPLVNGYTAELNQAFLHIVLNAIQAVEDRRRATGDNGGIEIETTVAGDHVQVSISDDGVGVAEDIRTRIFDPFFTTREVGKGAGQGLAVARAVIVDKHGGTLSLEPRLVRGSTFQVRLPIPALTDSSCVVPAKVYLSTSD